ncbi:MAG: hypothetical protein IJ776_09050 [Paludibacteraceae bacterium]|nr:hypothetical protein [Paludibacteraceae bacterium]
MKLLNLKSLFILVFLVSAGLMQALNKDDLDSLDFYLGQRAYYDNLKAQRIAAIQTDSQLTQYERLKALFDEYASYNYDSAHLYVNRLLDAATAAEDSNMQREALINKGFAYLSAGLFKESADLFHSIDISNADTAVRIKYFTTYARLLYDLADYNRSDLYYDYISQGNEYSELALELLSPRDTTKYWYEMAVRDMKQQNYSRSLQRFEIQLLAQNISEHEKAITYSSMGYIYYAASDMEQSLHYNILAAISDIKNSTKEAVALRNVALALFNQGETERAVRYIRVALDDAKFYNARHRQLEISQILPIIEYQQMEELEVQNKRIRLLSLITYALLLVLFIVMILLYNRVRAVQRAHNTIQRINNELAEANTIKEEYISTFLCNQTETLNQFAQYQRFVKRRAQERRTDELLAVPPQFNATRTRKEFYKQLDEMILRIFPDFIGKFNSLLREDEHIQPVKGELLSPELRIFALMRLGVSDNEKIAQILDYSVNTVYTYKTRVKNRSDLTNEQFVRQLAVAI